VASSWNDVEQPIVARPIKKRPPHEEVGASSPVGTWCGWDRDRAETFETFKVLLHLQRCRGRQGGYRAQPNG
jgi:hypothetical protein